MGVFYLALVLVVSIGFISAGQHDIYSKYSVHGVKVRTKEDQKVLQDLEVTSVIDIWQYGTPGQRDASVMVSPEHRDMLLKELDKNGITHYLDVPDVAVTLEEFDAELSRYRRNRVNRNFFEDYLRYAEVNEYIERIAAEYPAIATIVTAGPSFEGRDIKYLKISTTNFEDSSKPIYFMDAMMHAREWVTTPVALYSIHRLVEDLRENERDLLEDTDWIILPIVNPDGYEFSHITTRLWRRTRSFNSAVSETCYGVDANRNFDSAFNTTGVSANPCSDVYPGHEAFSEIETRYIRDIFQEYSGRLQMYMDIHSHGNYVLFPYGNGTVLPPNPIQVHYVGALMGAEMDTMKLPEAGYYLVGNSEMALYGTSGTGQDYAQDVGIPFSYVLELPGYGRAFQVPPEYISHFIEETWLGIAATARAVKSLYTAP